MSLLSFVPEALSGRFRGQPAESRTGATASDDTTGEDDRLGVVLVNHTDTVRPEVEMLTRSLSREAFDVTVLLPESARATVTHRDGVDYRYYDAWILPNVRYTVPSPSLRPMLRSALADADVLHIMGYVYLPCFVAAAVAQSWDGETLITVDAFPGVSWTYGTDAVDSIAKLYTHTLGRLTLSLVDCVVGIGEYLQSDIDRFTTDRTDTEVIHNGVDADAFSPAPVTPPTDQTPLELLYVGRLDTVKGVPHLLRAVSMLSERVAVHLTILGDGSRRAEAEALVRELGIADRVTFEGYQNEVRPYYRACDLFVLPSLSEGLPTVLIEAQACGVPVVSTDVGGARELVAGGRIVPPEDPGALARAIEELARQDLSELGERGREHVLANFTVDRMADQYATLYRTMATAD